MTCLKTARRLGLIKINEHEIVTDGHVLKWCGVISTGWLQWALCSVNDQVSWYYTTLQHLLGHFIFWLKLHAPYQC